MNLSTTDALEFLTPLFNRAIDSSLFYGGTVVMNPVGIKSYETKDYYYVGSLPFIKSVWFHASQYAKSLLIGLLIVLFGFGYLSWRTLLSISRRRKHISND
jgi:hypothetical protein